MSQRTTTLLFALLRSAIGGEPLHAADRAACSPERLSELIALSERHDVLHLLAAGLDQNALLDQNGDKLRKQILRAVYRCEKLMYDFGKLCENLEAAHIPFIPLKGSVIRERYPEPWMRTSCDIDILVREEDLDNAIDVLINTHGYTRAGKGSHDVSLFSANKTHVELHYTLVEHGRINNASAVLENVWDACRVRDGFRYWYEMPDELFYFYHIAHMAKHFESGGCGIKPFIDLWILETVDGSVVQKREALLKQGELLRFAQTVHRLSRDWFNGTVPDETALLVERYVLQGGVYGTMEQHVMIQQQRRGGKLGYALSRIFVPYSLMKNLYPVLERHRWLLPFAEIHRWITLLLRGRGKQAVRELRYNHAVSNTDTETIRAFLKKVGL